eukprot:m.51539 g.51539  ORF g.51539 m.51539 type:complete len:237 (-) comp6617_c0_seq3:240-950(-)
MAEATTFEDETRFFGISPVNVVDLVINAVNEFAVDGAENVMSLLKEPERVESLSVDVDHLPENMNVALGFVQKAIDKYFDLFELYCFKNIFHIPETLPLPGDLPEVVPTAEEEEALDKELKQLREQIQAEKYMQAAMARESKRLSAVCEMLEREYTLRSEVKQIFKKAGVPRVNDNIKFLSERLSAVAQTASSFDISRGSVKRPASALGAPQAKRARGEGEAAIPEDAAKQLAGAM